MRPFVMLLTIAAFGWHAVVGCCAHHAHADDGHTFESHACEQHACEQQRECDGWHAEEHEHSSCHDDRCALLFDGKVAPSGDELSAQNRADDLNSTIPFGWLDFEPPTEARELVRWQPPEREIAPSLRRHLLLQVLLT